MRSAHKLRPNPNLSSHAIEEKPGPHHIRIISKDDVLCTSKPFYGLSGHFARSELGPSIENDMTDKKGERRAINLA